MSKRVTLMIACLGLAFLLFTGGPPAQAEPDAHVYLETIGGLGGSYIYMIYAYIGVTADAYSRDIYEGEQIKVMMDETVNMLNTLMNLLRKVERTDVVASDKVFIDSMIEVFLLLKDEAHALATYAVSKDPADVERYDQARKTVWPKIKQLLGIK